METAIVRVAKPPGRVYEVHVEVGGRPIGVLSVTPPTADGQQGISLQAVFWPLATEQKRALAELAAAAATLYGFSVDIHVAAPPGVAAARPVAAGDAIVPGLVQSAQLPLLTAHRKRYGFARQFCAGRRVLDIACGAGYGARMLALAARQVVAADFDRAALGEAAWRFARANIAHVCADGTRLPFASGAFDVVVSCETIEHLWPEQVERFLGELRRVLAPGGTLVLSTPNVDGAVDPRWGLVNLTGEHQRGHQVGFSATTLRAWLRRFFPHVIVLYQGNQRLQHDLLAQHDLWPEPPATWETLVAVASATALDLAGLRLQDLPVSLYEPDEVEHFLAQPGIALVHATLEKRGPYHYAAFTLACARLGAAHPAYAPLDYVRVLGLGEERPRLELPAEWAAASPLTEEFARILAQSFADLSMPPQTFTMPLPTELLSRGSP
jgi:SAM-dependent methyltransferase